MTALARLAGSEPVDVSNAIQRFGLVHDRLEYEPEKANIQNCENSLRLAAQAIVQEWHRVQMLKADPNALKAQARPDLLETMIRVTAALDQQNKREAVKKLREVPQLTSA